MMPLLPLAARAPLAASARLLLVMRAVCLGCQGRVMMEMMYRALSNEKQKVGELCVVFEPRQRRPTKKRARTPPTPTERPRPRRRPGAAFLLQRRPHDGQSSSPLSNHTPENHLFHRARHPLDTFFLLAGARKVFASLSLSLSLSRAGRSWGARIECTAPSTRPRGAAAAPQPGLARRRQPQEQHRRDAHGRRRRQRARDDDAQRRQRHPNALLGSMTMTTTPKTTTTSTRP